MPKTKRLGVVGLLFALLLAWAIPSASAGTATVSGVLDAADPKMPVVTIATPNCTAQGATMVAYESHQFTVDAAGVYTLDLTSVVPAGGLVSLYLHAGGFNPAASFSTCVAADNTVPIQFTYALVPGVTYFAVAFDDTFAQVGGSYSLTISGPGNVTLGGLPGPDMVPIPATAVVGAFVVSTPAYFAPRADAATSTILDAGKTVWVFGVDASGGFYKVVLAGKFFWVPVGTMGPNYDAVWQGRPLPTGVVS